MCNALELCVDKWNQVEGKTKNYELVIEDSKNETKQGAIIANRFVSLDKPQIVVSTISSIVLNVQPIFEKAETINVALVGTDKLFDSNPKFTIRNFLTVQQTSKLIIQSIENEFNTNRFHFFIQTMTDMAQRKRTS